jgi:Kef-type K+ transport system membrane component KefB
VTEIVAGVLIGPQVLDIVRVTAPLEVFPQIGLVFLFILAGLEIAFDPSGERHLRLVGAAFVASLCIAVLAGLVLMAEEFRLEVVLGAFLAGAMVSFLDRDRAVESSGLQAKLEGIGFGVFIPMFFVVSGVQLDLGSLFSSFDTAVLVPATVIALLLVRGLPALLYGRFVERRQAIAAGLLQATSLSFVVAATQIGVELGKLDEAAAAGLVAGGVISVVVFPALALKVLDRETA